MALKFSAPIGKPNMLKLPSPLLEYRNGKNIEDRKDEQKIVYLFANSFIRWKRGINTVSFFCVKGSLKLQ